MSKLTNALVAIGIHNTHALLTRFGAKGQDVAVTYRAGQNSRPTSIAMTRVWSPSFKTNPHAAWYDYGQKTFIGNRTESFAEALAWATNQYAITDWVPDPFGGGRVPADVVHFAREILNDKEPQ